MRLKSKQQGMTMLGWILVLAILGIFVLAGLRLIPIYLNNVKLNSIMDGTKSELDGQAITKSSILSSLTKRYNVEGMSSPEVDEFKIKKTNRGYSITADYVDRAPFIGNVEFAVSFQKTVEINR